MSYTIGTSLGRLREMVGDTNASDELLSDSYLNDLLSTRNTVVQAAVTALRRIMMDPDLIKRRFKGYGSMNVNVWPNMVRVLEESVQRLLDGSEDMVTATGSDSAIPEADTDVSGFSTNEDGLFISGNIDTYLSELRARR
jgi:hypothetical protein